MNDIVLEDKEYWDNNITLKDYISRLKKYNYIDCSGNWDYEFHYIVENLEKLDKLQQENERLKELKENASKVCVAEHKYGVEKAEEARDYKSRINKVTNEINRIIEIIQEQPGKDKRDDLWVLDRLDGLLRIVSGW